MVHASKTTCVPPEGHKPQQHHPKPLSLFPLPTHTLSCNKDYFKVYCNTLYISSGDFILVHIGNYIQITIFFAALHPNTGHTTTPPDSTTDPNAPLRTPHACLPSYQSCLREYIPAAGFIKLFTRLQGDHSCRNSAHTGVNAERGRNAEL